MCRVPGQLKELVKQRLGEVAEEIFALVEKTISEYEEVLLSKYEQQKQQGPLCIPDGLCELPHIKEEQDTDGTEICVLKTEEQLLDPTWTRSPSPEAQPGVSGVADSDNSDVTVKTEEGGAWTPPLHLPQTVAPPPHIQTEALPPLHVQPVAPPSPYFHTVAPPPPHVQTVAPPPPHVQTVAPPPPQVQTIAPPSPHVQPVAPPPPHIRIVPPPGGPVLPHAQPTEELLPPDTWTDDELDVIRSPACSVPLSPPGAVLHLDSPGKLRKRRLVGRAQRRPHECPVCGLRFQSTFNLETHLRVHTGERPFSCPVCHKTFNRKDSMANHMKIHRGETFCCSECGKRYSDKSNLRRHALSVHAGRGHLGRTTAESGDAAQGKEIM